MCVLCTQLWVEEHWAEAASTPALETSNLVSLETHAVQRGARLRSRARRTRLFNLLLAQRGLSIQDWEGSRYILRDSKGRTAVVPSLAQVWAAAEQLGGSALDPLDPDHLLTVQRLIARMTMES